MSQHKELQRLYADYQRALSAQHFLEQDLDYSRLDYHLPLLQRLDAVEASSVVLYDLYRHKYVFLTASFKFLLGFQREQTLDQGPECFYRQMHPEDLPVVLELDRRSNI